MYKRIAAFCIIGVFIVAILLQLNSNLPLITIPNTTTNEPTTALIERYQRNYTTLVTYMSILFLGSIVLLLSRWIQQYKYKKNKLLGLSLQPPKISSWQRWTRWEWRLLSSTWSIERLLQLSCLIGLNVFLTCQQDGTVPHQPNHELSAVEERNMYLQLLANRSAQLALTNIAMSVLLSAKLSILQRYFFSIHQTLQWHTWFGRLGCIQVLYHATYQIQYNYSRQEGDVYLTFFMNIRHITGTFMTIALIMLVIGSHPIVRLFSYRLFRWTHISAFIVLILFGCFHHWAFYVFYTTVLIFWVMDQLDRSFITKSCEVDALPGNIVQLTCQVPYTCHHVLPGQFVFISFRSMSWIKAWFRSHPFSICKLNEDTFTFYIKANGKETHELYQHGQQKMEKKCRISQPLGRPYITPSGTEFGDYDHILLVAEGMGITPWISVLNYIKEKQHAIKTHSIQIIWSIHSLDTFYAFEKELRSVTIPQEFNMMIFITGMNREEEDMIELPNLDGCLFHIGKRPSYTQLFHGQKENTVLGICAHEETAIKVNNLGLLHYMNIITERFEL